MDMWGVNYMLVILKFLCTDVFIEVRLMFSLLELLLFLREGRVRCRVCKRVGTACNPEPELFNPLVRSRPRSELQ